MRARVAGGACVQEPRPAFLEGVRLAADAAIGAVHASRQDHAHVGEEYAVQVVLQLGEAITSG